MVEISTVQARVNEFVMWVIKEWRLRGDVNAAEIEYRLHKLELIDEEGVRVPEDVVRFLTGDIKEEDDAAILPPS